MTPHNGVDERKRSTLRRFAAVGAAAPLAAFSESAAASDNDVRNAITGYLSTTPGAHFSKIRDDLQLGTGEAQHHLRRLEEAGAVERYSDGDYKRFVLAGRFDEFEKTALGYLRRSTARGMIIELLRNSAVSANDLASILDVSAPTISKYAGELEAAGLFSRDDGYTLEHPETVLLLLVRYAESFGTRARSFVEDADTVVRYVG